MDEYLKLLTELAASLKKNKSIKVLECEIAASIPSEDLTELFCTNSPKFKTLGNRFGLFSGQSIIWKTKSTRDDYLMGDWFIPLIAKSWRAFDSDYKDLVLTMNLNFKPKTAMQ